MAKLPIEKRKYETDAHRARAIASSERDRRAYAAKAAKGPVVTRATRRLPMGCETCLPWEDCRCPKN